jgi:hypothetical protein
LERLEDRCVLSPAGFIGALAPTSFLDYDRTFVPTLGNTVTPTLRDAVMQANFDGANGQADTIYLAGGTYNLTETNGTGPDPGGFALDITTSLTIVGSYNPSPGSFHVPTIIHQTQQDRVLAISTTGTVSLRTYYSDVPLVISGGHAVNNIIGVPAPDISPALGGAIYNQGGNLLLTNVRVENNLAGAGNGGPEAEAGWDAMGGGIYSNGGTVALKNAILNNNIARAGNGVAASAAGTSSGYGGAAFGGGLYATNSTIVTLEGGDQFINNSAEGGKGGDAGAAVAAGSGGFAGGGGLYVSGEGTALDQAAGGLTTVTVEGNVALGGSGGGGSTGGISVFGGLASGGGICATSGAAVNLSGAVGAFVFDLISNNQAIGGAGAPAGATAERQDGGSGLGGGIAANQNATLTLKNILVLDNQAIGGAGGAAGGPVGGWGGVAEGGGIAVGALEAEEQNPDQTATLTMVGSSISGNQAEGGAGGGATGSNAGGGVGGLALGGGLLLNSASPTLTSLVIQSNRAVGGEGAAGATQSGGLGGAAFGGGIAGSGTLAFTSLQLDSNVAQGGSGGSGPQGNVGAVGGLAAGGGLSMEQGFLALNGGSVDSNQAIGGPGGSGGRGSTPGSGGTGGAAEGGALSAVGGEVVLVGPQMNWNSATGGSGGTGGKGVGTRGGNGLAGGPGGAGGIAQGGALYLVVDSGIGSPTMIGNVAAGGSGGRGGPGAAGVGAGSGGQGGAGGMGGLAQGGALFNAFYYTISSTTFLNNDSLLVNSAQGGNGGNGGSGGVSTVDPRMGYAGAGGNGGNAQGGGAYVDAGTSLGLTGSNVVTNFATAGRPGSGRPNGAGGAASGGGVYNNGGTLLQLGGSLIIANLPDDTAP